MGERITIRQPLIVELKWIQSEGWYIFRLLNGRRYATPRLVLCPYGMLQLEQGEKIQLVDKKGTPWLILGSDRRKIRIWFESKRMSFIEEDALTQWPDFGYGDFMAMARGLRGAPPSQGWEAILEARLDAQRVG